MHTRKHTWVSLYVKVTYNLIMGKDTKGQHCWILKVIKREFLAKQTKGMWFSPSQASSSAGFNHVINVVNM